MNPTMTLFRKELRDVLKWTPIGIIVIGTLCWLAIPRGVATAGQTESNLVSNVSVACALIALALGWLQSIPDARSDARGFLFHRPMTSSNIFWAKTAAGFVAYLVCVAPPLVVTALILESYGMDLLPASGWQVWPIAVLSLILFSFHPASIWTIHRDARWVGTRCLPLLLACLGAMTCSGLVMSVASAWHLLFAAATAIAVVSVIHFAALHAFAHQSFSPPPSSMESRSITRALGIAIPCVVIATAVVGQGLTLAMMQNNAPQELVRLAVTNEGEVWEVVEKVKYTPQGSVVIPPVRGRQVDDRSSNSVAIAPLAGGWQEAPAAKLFQRRQNDHAWAWRFRMSGYLMGGDSIGPSLAYFDNQGRCYFYDYNGTGMIACVTPEGIFARGETPRGQFNEVERLLNIPTAAGLSAALSGVLIIDSDGLYQVDLDRGELRKLIEAPIDYYHTATRDVDDSPVVWTLAKGDLRRFELTAVDPDRPLQLGPRPGDENQSTYALEPLSPMQSKMTGKWQVPPAQPDETFAIAETDDEITFLTDIPRYRLHRYHVYANDGAFIREGAPELSHPTQATGEVFQVVVPPVAFPAMKLSQRLTLKDDRWEASRRQWNASFLLIPLLHGCIAACLAFWLARSRGLSSRARWVWAVLAALVGGTSLLAMLAIYPRVAREPCHACSGRRRVDWDVCDHCGATWLPPSREGIEIIGARSESALVTS